MKVILKTIQSNLNFNVSSMQKFGENSNSTVVIADGDMNNLGKIINVFFNYKEFLGYEKNELIDQKIDGLIPETIAKRHDQIIIQFY